MPESAAKSSARSIYLETFGCQMNELDSELVRGQLSALGYSFIDNPDDAEVVLYNTCSVREQAENKALSRVGLVGARKRRGAKTILGVIGCLAEREGLELLRRHPQIDLLCGPGELDRLPMLIDNAFKAEQVALADRVALQGNNSRRSATLAAAEDNLELLDLSRAFDPEKAPAGGRAAYVRITRGCNKFCTYCVVPYTRGPEVHRPPDHIVDECRKLADQGVIEITLLGQTVNHYIYHHGAAVTVNGTQTAQIGPGSPRRRADTARLAPPSRGPSRGKAQRRAGSTPGSAPGTQTTTFADLLHRIHDEVPAIQRLRFVTSYPRDFGDDILHVIAACPRICRYLHVPAQSGSDRILKLMNRGYTRGQYLEFIDRARSILPDVSLAGDIIVGFPTETDEDFELTKSLLESVRCKNQFIFKYSPRPGTIAIDRYPDDVPEPVKRQRNNELLALQARISAEVHAEYVGREVEVFVEHISRPRHPESARPTTPMPGAVELRWETNGSPQARHDNAGVPHVNVPPAAQLSGRTSGDLIAVFDAPPGADPADLLGRIVSVRITGSGPLILRGNPIAHA